MERVAELSEKLEVPLDPSVIIQSHSPFAELAGALENKRVLVVGGDSDRCRQVAERYVYIICCQGGYMLTQSGTDSRT